MTFAVWAAVAASLAYWGQKSFVRSAVAVASASASATPVVAPADLARLLGADLPPSPTAATVPVAESSRFKLIGVVAPRSAWAANQGIALIAVDGRPARAYKVGAALDVGQVLLEVRPRGASIGAPGGAAAVALDLPAPASTASSLPTVRPPMPDAQRLARPDVAPNVLLNNPADMSPPNSHEGKAKR